MWFRSSSSALAEAPCPTSLNRRRHPRQKLRTLSYVTVDTTNRGVLRDVSESGFAAQTVPALSSDRKIRLRIDLQNPRTRIEGEGRVVWVDDLGQAGVEFVELSNRTSRSLKDWLFTQLLAEAHHADVEQNGNLLFSNSGRPAIRLGQDGLRLVRPTIVPRALDLHVFWFDIPAYRFARAVDILILLCATLLFHVMALFLTDVLPVWWIASALVLAVTGILVLAYWLLFGVCLGTTPGRRLAYLAARHEEYDMPAFEKEAVRFR